MTIIDKACYERGCACYDKDGVEVVARQWVGLTDKEVTRCWERMGRGLDKYAAFASAIEAKLKEKNA